MESMIRRFFSLGTFGVEAAVARLHVIDGNPHPFDDDRRKIGVGVAEDQHPVGLDLHYDFFHFAQNDAQLLR